LTIGHSADSIDAGSSLITACIVSTIDGPANGRRPAINS
jgi:hypothetical protein